MFNLDVLKICNEQNLSVYTLSRVLNCDSKYISEKARDLGIARNTVLKYLRAYDNMTSEEKESIKKLVDLK